MSNNKSEDTWLEEIMSQYAAVLLGLDGTGDKLIAQTEAELAIQKEIERQVLDAEMRGLDLIENAPRVPFELMSMVLKRKAELRKLQEGNDE